jgi:hypothetical protein
MNKMEITNHGRGLALTMGLANMHVCVLLGFVEGLCAEIDGFNVCVLLELSDSVYAGVVTACVVCVHAKMCVVQRNCDSLPKLRRLQRISIRCRN